MSENEIDRSAVKAEARAWLEENWNPDLTVAEWWQLLADSGWGFPTWPKEYFGKGLPAEVMAGVREAFAEVGALPPPGSLGQRLGAPTLLTHGSDEQKRRFLPNLANGQEMWCQLFSEPGSGSDLASAQTRAVRDGDRFVVNGQKVWTSGAQWSDRGMLVSRTDREVPKHRGITYFIIDMHQPGIEVRPLHQMNGAHGFNEVFFTDAVVDADRMVSEENGGWSVAVTTLMFERYMTGAPSAMPGTMSKDLDRPAGEVAREAAASGAAVLSDLAGSLTQLPAALDPVQRDRITDLRVLEEIDRLSRMQQADQVKAGQRPSSAGSLRKIYRSDVGRLRSAVGMSALGADGMLVGDDTPLGGSVQHLALSTPSSSIAGGTDEIQHNIVGERVLGLPKEPFIDRNTPFRDLVIGTRTSDAR